MADSLGGLPLTDLLDEQQLVQVQLATLDPSADDFHSLKMGLENRLVYLNHEIQKARREGGDDISQNPFALDGATSAVFDEPYDSSSASGAHTGDSSASFQSFQTNPALRSPPMNLPNRKRPRGSLDVPSGLQHQAKSRRTTPSPSASVDSSPQTTSSDGFEGDDNLRRFFGPGIFDDYRTLGKEAKRAQKELQERIEQERRDEDYARALQEEYNQQPPFSVPRATSQTVLDRTTGGIKTMPPPPKPSTSLDPYSKSFTGDGPTGSSSNIPSWSASSIPGSYQDFDDDSNIVDLGSEDDDDFEEIPSELFQPNINRGYNGIMVPPLPGFGHINPYSVNPTPWAGGGGTSVYSNRAYDYIDQQINGYGVAASGFASRTGPGSFPGISNSMPFPPIDLTRRGPWDEGEDGNTEEEIKNLLENIRPDEELMNGDREGDPNAMRFPLMAHQKLGLSWMKNMEEGSNKGGILADDMGLGKTIQALALIVSRPSDDSQCKTTLIVAPVALMQQWKREIEHKLQPSKRLSVLILHGPDRNRNWKSLKHYDIVLTTYGTIATELKRKIQWDAKKKANPNLRPTSKEDCLPLLDDECHWYRVILDEAQHIKNKSTKAALAAAHIRSKYRWCMTGTPMMNSVLELYSLIHFLRIRPYNSSESFNRDFTRPLKGRDGESKDRAMRALQALLKAILLRRTKKSKVDGKPLLQLPDKIVEATHAAFSQDELAFYQGIEGKAQLTFNRYLSAGTVGRNYSNILVLLLRLRQACCHPHLIKDFGIETAANTEINLKANAEAFGPEVVARLKEVEAFDCPICIDVCENPQIFFPCGHAACLECFSRMSDPTLALAEGRDGSLQIKCPHCRTPLDPTKVTDFNTFKAVHFPDANSEQSEAELIEKDEKNGSESDTETGSETETESDTGSDSETEDGDVEDDDSIKDFVVSDEDEDALKAEPDDDDDDLGSRKFHAEKPNVKREDVSSNSEVNGSHKGKEKVVDKPKKLPTNPKKSKKSSGSKRQRKQKKKGKGKEREKLEKTKLSLAQLRKDGLKNKKAKRRYLDQLAEDWISSAKVDKTMEILQAVHDRGHGEKTIVFSAFTSLLDLLEVPISRKDWNYRRYDGSLRPAERNDAVLEFSDKPSCTIMLVSLKAGNAGLNLTAANNVVIFDPFWNPYIEEQAIDRAYRIGQRREVHVHRIIVPDTVEDRILALQEKKRELIENALDENAGRSVARLGERELAYLFGVRRNT